MIVRAVPLASRLAQLLAAANDEQKDSDERDRMLVELLAFLGLALPLLEAIERLVLGLAEGDAEAVRTLERLRKLHRADLTLNTQMGVH